MVGPSLVATGRQAFRKVEWTAIYPLGYYWGEFVRSQGPPLSTFRTLASLGCRTTGLGRRAVPDATWEFHPLCEGLAALELRCNLPPPHAQHLWTDALPAIAQPRGALAVDASLAKGRCRYLGLARVSSLGLSSSLLERLPPPITTRACSMTALST